VVLVCQWARIGQAEAFPGRCAEAGEELGSAIVTARLACDLIRLRLLMRRRYPPHSKRVGRGLRPAAGGGRDRPGPAGRASGTWAGPPRPWQRCTTSSG
jgi:hypothetical protein